jgi:hypothetical protein
MEGPGLWSVSIKKDLNSLWSEEVITDDEKTIDTIDENNESSTAIQRVKRVLRVDFNAKKGDGAIKVGDAMLEIITGIMMEVPNAKFWSIDGKWCMFGEYQITTEKLFRSFYHVERTTTGKGGEKVAVYFKMESKTSVNAMTLKKNNSIMQALKNNSAFLYWHKLQSPAIRTIGYIMGISPTIPNKEETEKKLDDHMKDTYKTLEEKLKAGIGKVPDNIVDNWIELNVRRYSHKTKDDSGREITVKSTILEVKTTAEYTTNMTRILYEVSLKGKEFGTFVPSKTAGSNNILFRNEMLRHNKAMDELEFIILKGVSKELMNTTIILNNQKVTVKDAITSKITETSKEQMETKALFDGVYMTNEEEQNWTLTTKTEHGQEAEDHLNVIIYIAQETDKFKEETKLNKGKEITIRTRRNKSARTFEEYNTQLERDNDSASRTEGSFVNDRYYRDKNQTRNDNKVDFGITTVYVEGNTNNEDGKQKFRKYSDVARGNKGTSVGETTNSKISESTDNSPDGSLNSLQSTVSSIVETTMFDYMRKIEFSREKERIEARKERQEFMKFEREETRKQQKEFMDSILEIMKVTHIAQSGTASNKVAEAFAVLDAKKTTIAKIDDDKTNDDINKQEKVLAKNEKKEPPRKRLDISATPQQFTSGNQKKYPEKRWSVMGPELFEGLIKPKTTAPMTPQRNNTIQQKEITTSSEFNNECNNIMNDDEDKDRKMRGRPGDTGSSGQCG